MANVSQHLGVRTFVDTRDSSPRLSGSVRLEGAAAREFRWRGLALWLAVACIGGAQASTPVSAQEGALLTTPAVQKLLVIARTEGAIPVIVQFDVASVTGRAHRMEATLGDDEASAQRAAIATVREGVLAATGIDPAEVKAYDILPLFATVVDAVDLTTLAADARVQGIYRDVAVPPSLRSSIPVIGADEAWAAGHSGGGQMIAILDTGIANRHPFLSGKVLDGACYSTTVAGSSTEVCDSGTTGVDAGPWALADEGDEPGRWIG